MLRGVFDKYSQWSSFQMIAVLRLAFPRNTAKQTELCFKLIISMNAYKLRNARADEIVQMQTIDLESSELFRGTGLIEFGPDEQLEPIPEDRLRQAFGDQLIWVAADAEDRPVGFCMCADMGPDLYLDQVSVLTTHGKQGLGAQLVQRAIEEASNRKHKRVTLSTFRDVPWNGPFYQRLGFKEISPRRYTDWQKDIVERQKETMDVTLRCFMERPVKRLLW